MDVKKIKKGASKMETLILYYSYTGKTTAIANALAIKESADIAEIKSVARPGKFKAYTSGCFASMRGKIWPIQPIDKNLSEYERIIILAPVWAGFPPPYINSVIEKLPSEKTVAIKMISASGKSSCREKLEAAIVNRGCTFESFEDIKA